MKVVPPTTSISRHTNFFIPSLGATQGPPVTLQPGDPGPFHPLQIFLDALFGNVAVHPMPPNPWFGLIGRVLELFQQHVSPCLLGFKRVRTDRYTKEK